MEVAPSVEAAFFPLDEELELCPNGLTPLVFQAVILLGTLLPFGQVGSVLHTLMQIHVSKSSIRRITEQAGKSLCAFQDQQAHPLAQVEAQHPLADRLAMATDGLFIPVLPNEWTEVKMVSIGEVGSKTTTNGKEEATCSHLSYFARLADAETFTDLACGEIRRRGIDQVREVAALQDGAEWIGPFVQGMREDAVRILDFAHAAQYVNDIGEEAGKQGASLPASWLKEQLHLLKHEGPPSVLPTLVALSQTSGSPLLSEKLAYLQKREAHMQYPTYLAEGWPIGSGIAESGNKLVVEARLKGPGMHWKRENVNSMLALRTTFCSDRWAEGWNILRTDWQQQRHYRFHAHGERAIARATADLYSLFCGLPLVCQMAWMPRPAPAPVSQPKGRTQGQKQWGRRAFTPRGRELQTEFAKK
jgi:hypothetical protein